MGQAYFNLEPHMAYLLFPFCSIHTSGSFACDETDMCSPLTDILSPHFSSVKTLSPSFSSILVADTETLDGR